MDPRELEQGAWSKLFARNGADYYKVSHPKLGQLVVARVAARSGISLEDLEAARDRFASCPSDRMLGTRAVLADTDGQLLIVLEHVRAEDLLGHLIQVRGRPLLRSDLEAKGCDLIEAIALAADEVVDAGCSPDLDRSGIVLQGAAGDLLSESAILRLSPWNLGMIKAGAVQDPDRTSPANSNETLIEEVSVEEPVVALGRLVYELVGGNPRYFRPDAFRKVPELSSAALDLLQALSDGTWSGGKRCLKWAEEFRVAQLNVGGHEPPRSFVPKEAAPASPPAQKEASTQALLPLRTASASSPADLGAAASPTGKAAKEAVADEFAKSRGRVDTSADPPAPPPPANPQGPAPPAGRLEAGPGKDASSSAVATPFAQSTLAAPAPAPASPSARRTVTDGSFGRAVAPAVLLEKYPIPEKESPQIAGKGGCAGLIMGALLLGAATAGAIRFFG